ncbi:Cyclin-A1-2 [Thoreauomyces humboldtii]|nr:Cyclin-A1-2 [Thoreauomyces humboldtii]
MMFGCKSEQVEAVQSISWGDSHLLPECPNFAAFKDKVNGDYEVGDLKIILENSQADIGWDEAASALRKDWTRSNGEINLSHRAVVVDWLAELAADQRLHPSTYHVSVNYFDTFMNLEGGNEYTLYDLQLIAIAMLVVAAKKEQVELLSLAEILQYELEECPCDEQPNRLTELTNKIAVFERKLTQETQCKLNMPTSYDYLARSLRLAELWEEEIENRDARSFFRPCVASEDIDKILRLLGGCVVMAESLRFSVSLLSAAIFMRTKPVQILCEEEADFILLCTNHSVSDIRRSGCLEFVERIDRCMQDTTKPERVAEYKLELAESHLQPAGVQLKNLFDVNALVMSVAP